MRTRLCRVILLTALAMRGAGGAEPGQHGHDGKQLPGGQALPQYSPQELERIYESLPPEEKALVDKHGSDPLQRQRILTAIGHERLAKEERRARREARARQHAAQLASRRAPPAEAPPQYDMDPLLGEAWRYYTNEPGRDRDKAVRLFQLYLDKEPDSPFLPDVYFRMGTLYSTHRNVEAGESYERELARRYFEKAHELYGQRYCPLNECAWMTLANYSKDLAFKRRCYDWMRALLQNGTIADIYPCREIGQCVNGRPPELDEAGRQVRLLAMRSNLPGHIRVMEKSIFQSVAHDRRALKELTESYPETELGRQAAMRLALLGPDLTGEVLDRALQDGPCATGPEHAPETPATSSSHAVPPCAPATALTATGPIGGRAPRPEWLRTVAAGLAVAGILALAVLLPRVRRRRRPHEAPPGT